MLDENEVKIAERYDELLLQGPGDLDRIAQQVADEFGIADVSHIDYLYDKWLES